MKKQGFIIAAILLGLTACTCNHPFQTGNNPATTTVATNENTNTAPISGEIAKSMDTADKEKVSRALDKPIGKSTDWTNETTGISYTVTPTEKLTIKGNPYCRKYKVESTMNDNHEEVNGTACVSASDSNWRLVSLG
jgi:surface antigen